MSSVPSSQALVSHEYPGWIKCWFALDAFLALFPPIYWAASGPSPSVLGLPLSVFYFVLTGVLIAGSIVAAYLVEVKQGNFEGSGTHHIAEGQQ